MLLENAARKILDSPQSLNFSTTKKITSEEMSKNYLINDFF